MDRTADEIVLFGSASTPRSVKAFVACMTPIGAVYASDLTATALVEAIRRSASAVPGEIDLGTPTASSILHVLPPFLYGAIMLIGLFATHRQWFCWDNYAVSARKATLTVGILLGALIFALAAWKLTLETFGFHPRPFALRLDFSPAAILWTAGDVVLVPIGEEILFRDWLYGTLRRQALSPLATIIISSLPFAIIHYGTAIGFVRAVYIVSIGLLFGAIRHFSRNVPMSIAAHVGVNIGDAFFA